MDYSELQSKVEKLEMRVTGLELQYAVINTKLSAIIWILAGIGTAIIGVLVKYVLNF